MYGMGVDYTIQYCLLLSFMQKKYSCACRKDHTTMKAPLAVCSSKLSIFSLIQYYGGIIQWNSECCYFCCPKYYRGKHHRQNNRTWKQNGTLTNASLVFVVQRVTYVLNFDAMGEGGKRDHIYIHCLVFLFLRCKKGTD